MSFNRLESNGSVSLRLGKWAWERGAALYLLCRSEDSLTTRAGHRAREPGFAGSLSGHPNQPEPFYLVSWQSLEIPSLKIHINDAETRRSLSARSAASGAVISISVVKSRAEFGVRRGNSEQPSCLGSGPNWAVSDT